MLAEVVFEVPVEGSLGTFSKAHADTRAVVRVLESTAEGARLLLVLAGPTEVTGELVRALRAELAGGAFEVLSITPYSVVVRALAPPGAAPWAEPAAQFAAVFGPDTILEPVTIHDGKARVRGIAARPMDTRAALAKLQELQQVGAWAGFRVLHVREVDPKSLGGRSASRLDPEQEDLLRLAIALGYYDTPRRCSLEDIAARVGLSVSPVHKKLKDVEHTLIRGHLEPDAPQERRRRRPARTRGEPGGLMREVTVRLVPRSYGPADFTRKFEAARVVVQPLPDQPGIAAHLHIVLAGPEGAAAFLRIVEADPHVVGTEVLSRDATHLTVKVRRRAAPGDANRGAGLGADPLQPLLDALGHDAFAKPAVCERGEVVGRFVVMRRLGEEQLEATLQELAPAAGWDEVELVGVRDVTVEGELLAAPKAEKMTGRQEEVLRIAHALGYYNTPRKCTLEDVAATLGISANAVHKNLTAAEQRIIHAHIAGR